MYLDQIEVEKAETTPTIVEVLPEKLCSKCGQRGEFPKRGNQCRACKRAYGRAYGRKYYAANADSRAVYREANRDRHRKSVVEIHRRRHIEHGTKIDELKSAPCMDCKGVFPPYVMDFDHRDPKTKVDNVSSMAHKHHSWAIIKSEIACASIAPNYRE